MRNPTPIQALGAAAALALLAGCSSGSAIAPKPSNLTGHGHPMVFTIRAAVGPLLASKINLGLPHNHVSFDACPATGPIEYISDFNNSVVNIYAGKFNGQAACGTITDSFGQGMFIKGHDLYLANSGGLDTEAFHRGSTTPFLTFTDPAGPEPADVTVAKDGTVIVSNIAGGPGPSISTFKANGTFVGNFLMPNASLGLFVTVQKNGKMYYNDNDATTGAGVLWTGSCPAGACGTFTQVTGVSTLGYAGGLRSATGEDLTQIDQSADTLTTFETLPTGTSCTFPAGGPVADDLSKAVGGVIKHVFYADATNNKGVEVKYKTSGACTLVGTVPGNSGGLQIGAAVDPEVSLH